MQDSALYSVRDADFDPQQISGYHLCLGLCDDSAAMAVFDPVEDRCLALERHRFEGIDEGTPELLGKLVGLSNGHDLLGDERWREMTVVSTAPAFAFVPEEWMEEGREPNLLGMSFDYRDDLHDLLNVEHQGREMNCLFALEKEVRQWVGNRFPNARTNYLNAASAVVEGLLGYEEADGQPTLAAVVNAGMTTFAFREGDSVRFANTFETRQDDEFLYFLFLTMEEAGLTPETARLLVWGDLMSEDALFFKLRKHVAEVKTGKRPKGLKFGHAFLTVPFQQGFELSSAYALMR